MGVDRCWLGVFVTGDTMPDEQPLARMRQAALRAEASTNAWLPSTSCAGSAHALALARLGSVVGQLPTWTEGTASPALSSPGLVGKLLRLLGPFICSSAVALQLPPERRPREVSWERAAHIAAFMHGARYAQPETVFGGIVSGRLLVATAQLVQHAPPLTCAISLQQIHFLTSQVIPCWLSIVEPAACREPNKACTATRLSPCLPASAHSQSTACQQQGPGCYFLDFHMLLLLPLPAAGHGVPRVSGRFRAGAGRTHRAG